MTSTALGRVQALDSEHDRARRQAADLQARLTDRTDVEALRETERRAAEAQTAARAKLRDRELELATLETRIGELERRLYSGHIQNPKELGSYERELQMFKLNQGRIEEDVLGLMENVERADAAAGEARRAREAAESEWTASAAQWQRELDALGAQVAEHAARLVAMRSTIDADILARYDRLRKRMPLAAAPVRHGACAACGIGLSADVIEQARAEDTAAVCDNCGRILYGE